MWRRWTIPALLLGLASCGVPSQRGDPLARARAATVTLEVAGQDEEGPWLSHATGSLVHPAGYVLTCEHATAHGQCEEVVLADGRRFPYRVVSRAGGSFDLAVLAFEAPEGLVPMRLAPTDAASAGDTVTILGNPGGRGLRPLRAILRRIDAGGGTQLETIRGAVEPGDSGGPVLDARGRQIGHVHVAIRGEPGIARHIRIEHVRAAFRDWLWAGEGRPGLRLECLGGPASVLAVRAGSPAARAGVRVGDVILEVDTHRPHDGIACVLRLLDRRPGVGVRMVVTREGARRRLNLSD